MGTQQVIGILFAIGGVLMSTFAQTVLPDKWHVLGFYFGLVAVVVGALLFLPSLPIMQHLAERGWPKNLTLLSAIAFLIFGGWWLLSSESKQPEVSPQPKLEISAITPQFVNKAMDMFESKILLIVKNNSASVVNNVRVTLRNISLPDREKTYIGDANKKLSLLDDQNGNDKPISINSGETRYFIFTEFIQSNGQPLHLRIGSFFIHKNEQFNILITYSGDNSPEQSDTFFIKYSDTAYKFGIVGEQDYVERPVPITRKSKEEAAQKDMQIWEAIEHVRNVIGDDDENGCYKRTQLEVRQAALDGKIKIYGKKELKSPSPSGHCSDVHTKIVQEYWRDHKLNSMATGRLFENHDHTWSEPHQAHGYKNRYWNLLLNSNEVKAIWPTQETSAATPKPKDSEYISLDDAAIRAYEEGRNTIMATAAETATDNYQPNPKKYFSNWLIGSYENPKMKVYGCKHQLNIREEIPHSELYSNELKYNDKEELVLQDKTYKHTKYHKLCVKRKELEVRLTEIQERFKNV